jgi:hypothetical protein
MNIAATRSCSVNARYERSHDRVEELGHASAVERRGQAIHAAEVVVEAAEADPALRDDGMYRVAALRALLEDGQRRIEQARRSVGARPLSGALAWAARSLILLRAH